MSVSSGDPQMPPLLLRRKLLVFFAHATSFFWENPKLLPWMVLGENQVNQAEPASLGGLGAVDLLLLFSLPVVFHAVSH